MAIRCDPLQTITPVRECWRIKVRIIRLWCLPAFNNAEVINSLEMVVMDEFGTTIHATVKKELIYKFKPLLTEGSIYVMSYFTVSKNGGYFRTTRHEFRLNLQLRTNVLPSNSDLIPLYGFNLMPFNEILQADTQFPYLIDTIGLLTAVGGEKEYDRDGRKTRMVVLQLEADGDKLEVALFGQFVYEVRNFVAKNEGVMPVVIVQFAKVKTFKGKIVLQNVMFGTRLLFEPNIPEVVSFRARLPPLSAESSQSLSLLSDDPTYSLEHDFLKATPRIVIKDLRNCVQDGLFVVHGTVSGINTNSDWWYIACKCNKAVKPDSRMYYCERCFRHVVNVTPRYRIKIHVTDESGTADFVIFDREGQIVIGKPCSELCEHTHKSNGEMSYPREFEEKLLQQSFLFKIEVKASVNSHYEPSFKVLKVCFDKAVIKKFIESTVCLEKANVSAKDKYSLEDDFLKAKVNTNVQYYSLEDDLLKDNARKSLEQLKNLKNSGVFVVLATVKCLDGVQSWWYPACKCGEEVVIDKGLYFCGVCDRRVVVVIPRYRVKIRVIDETDGATFILWDPQGCQLLGNSCSAMLECIQLGSGQLSYPKEFNELLFGKEFIFKVVLKDFELDQNEHAFDIIDACDDQSIISKFKESNSVLPNAEPDMTVGLSLGEKSSSFEFQEVQSSSSVAKDLMTEFVEAQCLRSSQGDSDIPSLTPAKRSSLETEGKIDGDMSTTQLKTKKLEKLKLKQIKMEKD